MISLARGVRIGFISEHYPPTDGGVATSTQRVARNLHKLGADVHVLCFDHSRPLTSKDYVCHENDDGVRVSRVGPFFLKQKSQSADRIPEKLKATFRRRAFNQMLHILKDEEVDILLSFYLLNAGFLANYVARGLGVPVVAGVRGNDIGRNIFHTERFAVTQWVISGAERVVCVNEFLRKRLMLAFPEAAAKSVVIPNSVPMVSGDRPNRISARNAILEQSGWDDTPVIVAFIGALREKKGVDTLLSALDILPSASPIRLMVVGPQLGGFEKHICGELWDRLVATDRVWCTGRIPLETVPSWAIGADIVAMPSIDDGMANGLLEGMSLGLCPIVTEIFGDVVADGINGIVVQAGDYQALANAFDQLSWDPIRIKRLGEAARVSMERRTPSDEAKAYLELFQEILHLRHLQGAGYG